MQYIEVIDFRGAKFAAPAAAGHFRLGYNGPSLMLFRLTWGWACAGVLRHYGCND